MSRAPRVSPKALCTGISPAKTISSRTLFTTRYLELARVLDRLQVNATGPRAKLDAVIREFCRFFDADRILFRFLLFVQHEHLSKLSSDQMTPVDVIRRIVAGGMRTGDIPKSDADLCTAMVIELVLQAATAAVYGRIDGKLSRHADRLSNAAWSVLVHT